MGVLWPRILAAVLLLAVVAPLGLCDRSIPLTLGTFNIRMFPGPNTDREAVASAIAELDADAFAVQEIVAPDEFRRVLERASALTGRHYAVALEPVHFPGITETMHVGVVHDLAALELVEARLLGEFIRPRGQPAGMLALLRARDGRRLALASVHFSAGDTPARREDRVAQWSWLVAALPELRGEWAAPVIVAGDFNSTGYLVDGDPERRFIDALVEQHALQLPTAGLACSMYWQRSKTTFAVSLLDHVLAPGDLSFGPAEALGMCAELACAPQTAAPTAWVAVSDHCPVRVPLKF